MRYFLIFCIVCVTVLILLLVIDPMNESIRQRKIQHQQKQDEFEQQIILPLREHYGYVKLHSTGSSNGRTKNIVMLLNIVEQQRKEIEELRIKIKELEK